MNAVTATLQLGVWTDACRALEDQLADKHKLSLGMRVELESELARCQSRVRYYENELELKAVREEIKELKAEQS